MSVNRDDTHEGRALLMTSPDGDGKSKFRPTSPDVDNGGTVNANTGGGSKSPSSPALRKKSLLYDVEERSYADREDFTKNASNLKYRWEQAPRGRVITLKHNLASEPSNYSPASSLLEPAAPDGQMRYGTDFEVQDHGAAHYTPGVAEHSLGQLRATSIAGNDISSSCLYATGIVATAAGIYAPFASLGVCIVLYWFREIYSEVFSALPMNGGTYNALLNTSSKNMAALAAVLSTISYTATAVTSAASAGAYLQYEWPSVPAEWVCIGILVFFALLTLMGIKDSANTATVLFCIHLATMGTLVVASIVFVIHDGGQILKASWNSTSAEANPQGSPFLNLFYGYCSALLGVTGFESSSNYIEEQKPGVFPKTLRNMWIAITLINPALAVFAMGVIPINVLVDNANYSLAFVGNVAIGGWFRTVIVVDAALVLAGAVLTAYVGITGLHRRLALDRIMPHFFLNVNSFRKTNHWIIILFCVLTCSLRLLVDDMDTLGGVYAIAFLGVMTLFCVSNFLLKFKRGKLPRTPIAHPLMVLLALVMVVVGIGGNCAKDPDNAEWFLLYFAVFGVAVVGTKLRVTVLRFLTSLLPKTRQALRLRIEQKVHELRSFPVVFFVKEANLNMMNKAIHYIVENEDTRSIKIVHMEGQPKAPSSPPSAAAVEVQKKKPPHGKETEAVPLLSSEDAPALIVDTPQGHHYDDAYEYQRAAQAAALERSNNTEFLPGSSPVDPAVAAVRAATAAVPREDSRSRTRRVLENWCTILDELYPKLTIDIIFVDEPFGPESVHHLSEQLGIPKNYMFMTCPSDKFNHTVGHLGGVRVIQH